MAAWLTSFERSTKEFLTETRLYSGEDTALIHLSFEEIAAKSEATLERLPAKGPATFVGMYVTHNADEMLLKTGRKILLGVPRSRDDVLPPRGTMCRVTVSKTGVVAIVF